MMDKETNVSSPSPSVKKENGNAKAPESSSPRTPVAGRIPSENRETPSSVRQRRSAVRRTQTPAASAAENAESAAAERGFAIEIGDIRSPISADLNRILRFDQIEEESANGNVPIAMPEVSPADDVVVAEAAIPRESIIRIDSRIVAQSLAIGMMISSARIMIGSVQTIDIGSSLLPIVDDAGMLMLAGVHLIGGVISYAHLAYDRFALPPSPNNNLDSSMLQICGALAGISAIGAARSLIRSFNGSRIDSASRMAIHAQLPLGLCIVRRVFFAQSQSGNWRYVTAAAIAIVTIGGSHAIIGATRHQSNAATPGALLWWYAALCAQIAQIVYTRQRLTRRGVDCRISIAMPNASSAIAFVATAFATSAPCEQGIIRVPANVFAAMSYIAGSVMQYAGTYLSFATNRFAASVTTAAGFIGGRPQSAELVWSIRITSETITLMIVQWINGRLDFEPLTASVIVTQAILIPLMLTNESRICEIGATISRSMQQPAEAISMLLDAATFVNVMRNRAIERITNWYRSISDFAIGIRRRIREANQPNRVRYVRYRRSPLPEGEEMIEIEFED